MVIMKGWKKTAIDIIISEGVELLLLYGFDFIRQNGGIVSPFRILISKCVANLIQNPAKCMQDNTF